MGQSVDGFWQLPATALGAHARACAHDLVLIPFVACLSRSPQLLPLFVGLPESFAFPLLDVLRLVLAREDVAAHYAANPEDGDLLASLSAFAVRVDSRATAIMFLRGRCVSV